MWALYPWPLHKALTQSPPHYPPHPRFPSFLSSRPPPSDSLFQLFVLWRHTPSSSVGVWAGDGPDEPALLCVDMTHTPSFHPLRPWVSPSITRGLAFSAGLTLSFLPLLEFLGLSAYARCPTQMLLTCHLYSPGSLIKMWNESKPDPAVFAICGVLTFVITTEACGLERQESAPAFLADITHSRPRSPDPFKRWLWPFKLWHRQWSTPAVSPQERPTEHSRGRPGREPGALGARGSEPTLPYLRSSRFCSLDTWSASTNQWHLVTGMEWAEGMLTGDLLWDTKQILFGSNYWLPCLLWWNWHFSIYSRYS